MANLLGILIVFFKKKPESVDLGDVYLGADIHDERVDHGDVVPHPRLIRHLQTNAKP